ncbi:hypothetical protein KHS38_12180 [Mucilaginibacter sp. Bleaf8]|uniref:hypothetical protein n=1 Tax=Mucilaginibacter sp. Bleaf8 TaxID=2834430 RepID=UPI001BCE70BD|nr:hypothetical protein [Mucilaginibacter sp. Bleaf8]MBS7565163.1 hypothetical protein [Mucilaginibacter sp. Bleaf8]
MIYELAEGIIWDTEQPLYAQQPEAQELAYTAMWKNPINETTEPTLNGYHRTLTQVYAMGNYFLNVQYLYNELPTSKEWAGLENVLYTLTTTING